MSKKYANTTLDDTWIDAIVTQEKLLSSLSDNELADFCVYANQTYRFGQPIIRDEDYDFIYLAELKKRIPNHSLLHQVEAEGAGFSEQKYLLPQAMLSTDKAYTLAEVKKWLERVKKYADDFAFATKNIQIQATPKLDGFAAFDDGERLYTRGDGKKGSDISRVFARGLSVFSSRKNGLGKRGLGAGEIVVKKSYFAQNLSHKFEYQRNFQASIIKEKALDALTQKAITERAALFVPFVNLPSWQGSVNTFYDNFDQIINRSLISVDFDVDGVVLAVVNPEIRAAMGSTRKFHRWQLAFKENKDKAQVRVLGITPQVGRTGKITPVAELEPTLLSGATLRRASAHHYGFVKSENLGKDSIVELTRSGLVIPKINRVLKATQAEIPKICPSCQTPLVWQSDFLCCPNYKHCEQQAIAKLVFFFATLANNDGFGLATIKKLYSHQVQTLPQIYRLDKAQLVAMGFGDKTSDNLLFELEQSKKVSIEDWRLLAAFGIERLGLGNCERLLQHYALADIFSLSTAQIAAIEGFAELSATGIVSGLASLQPTFTTLLDLADGFNLEITPRLGTKSVQSTHLLANKSVVFSGKMQHNRTEMQKQAKTLGIKVLSNISKQCDYLIVGENVGQSKLSKANTYGTKILSEVQYLAIINE